MPCLHKTRLREVNVISHLENVMQYNINVNQVNVAHVNMALVNQRFCPLQLQNPVGAKQKFHA